MHDKQMSANVHPKLNRNVVAVIESGAVPLVSYLLFVPVIHLVHMCPLFVFFLTKNQQTGSLFLHEEHKDVGSTRSRSE